MSSQFIKLPEQGGGGGSGTVTSVGLSLPNIFTVSGSPVTTSGTLTAVFATEVKNTFLAGPTTGSDAAPTFRTIVASDLSTISANISLSNLASPTAINSDLQWGTPSGGSIGVGLAQTSGTDYRPKKIYVADALIVGSPGGTPPYGTNNALVTGAIQAGNQTNVLPFFGSSTFWNSVGLGNFAFLKDGSGTNAPAFINLDSGADNNVYFSLLHRNTARADYLKFGTGTLTFMQSSGADLLWDTDGGGDIGASGATRPRNIFTTANISVGGQAYSSVGSTQTPAGTTATINWNTGNTQVLDLGSASGDVTVTLSNGQNGATYTLFVLQGAVTRNVVVTAKWPGGIPPVITPVSSAVDILSFVVRGGVYYGVFNQAFS